MIRDIELKELLAAIINRSLDDVGGRNTRRRKDEPDRAMYFILNETCEAYCDAIGIDYDSVKEKAAFLYQHKKPFTSSKRIKRIQTQ